MLHVRSKNLDISPPWSSNLPESVENAGWKDEQAKFKIELWDSDLQWLHIPGGICPLYYVTMVVLNSFVGLVAIIHASCCLAYYGFWFSLQALTSDYSVTFSVILMCLNWIPRLTLAAASASTDAHTDAADEDKRHKHCSSRYQNCHVQWI